MQTDRFQLAQCIGIRSCLIPLLLVLVTSSRCTFDPDEEYYKAVQQPDPTPTSISFFLLSDTVDFRGYIDLSLSSVNQGEIVSHKLTLNDVVLLEQNGAPYTLTINSRNFPDGLYDLKLKIIKRLTGESLASKLGEEFSEEELIKKVFVYNAPIPKPQMYTSIENGILMLHWKPYTGRSFKKYVIQGSTIDPLTITDAHQSSIPIENFGGGRAYFSMQVHAFREWSDEQKQFDYPLNVSITKTPQGIHLSWDESPFANYNGSEVEVTIGEARNKITLDKTQRSLDYDLTWTFPHNIHATVSSISKAGVTYPIAGKAFTTQFPLGRFDEGVDLFKTSSDTVMIKLTHSIGTSVHTKTLTLINTNNDNTITLKRGFIGISPNGQLAYEFRDKTTLMRIDPTTLDYVEAINIESLITNISSITTTHAVFVANTNVVVLYVEQDYSNKPEEDWVYGIDCNSKQLLYSTKMSSYYALDDEHGKLSDNGRTLYQFNKITKIDQTPTSVIRTLTETSPYYQTALVHREEVITRYTGYLHKKQVYAPYTTLTMPYTKQVINIFSSNDDNIVGIAYAENNVIKFDFLDAATLNTLFTLESTYPWNYWSPSDDYYAFIIDRTFYLYDESQVAFHKFDF